MKTQLFPRQAIAKTLFLNSRYTWDTLFRIWSTLKKNLTPKKRTNFLRIHNCNLFEIMAIFRWNTNFYLTQSIAITFILIDRKYTGNTPYRNWFELDISLIRWKRPLLKFIIRGYRKLPYEKLTFFQKQAVTMFILYENLTTLMILHTKFGLIGRTPGPNQKDLFLQSLSWKIGNFPYEKLIFFPGKRYQIFFVLDFR